MNIVDAYLEIKKQCIIFISGVPGSGTQNLAKNLANDFKFSTISYQNYILENDNEIITLKDGSKFINIESFNSIDWKNMTKDIENKKTHGVIVVAPLFPASKLGNLEPDIHINVKLSKQNLLTRRYKKFKKYLEKDYKNLSKEDLTFIFNKYIYPPYLEELKNEIINKIINGNNFINETDEQETTNTSSDLTDEPEPFERSYNKSSKNDDTDKIESEKVNEIFYDQKIYDEAFYYIIFHIEKWLATHHKTKQK